MHASEFSEVGFCYVHVEGLALVHVGTPVCHHVDKSSLRDLPYCLVQPLHGVRNTRDFLRENKNLDLHLQN